MKNTWVIGDIHGELDKLKDVIHKMSLKDGDRIIQIGDVVDRGLDSFGVIEYLLELSKYYEIIFIKGNHDNCWHDYLLGKPPILWNQGARETELSYIREGVDKSIHLDFFKNQIPYFVDEEGNCYVHGGFNRHEFIMYQSEQVLTWDRDLFLAAMSYQSMKDHSYPFKMKDKFNKVFVGHTPTTFWHSSVPIKAANVINVDTGCGKGGLLSAYNVNTNEYVQS